MTIEVREYVAADKDDWDDFLKRSINGTIYHSIKFLEYYTNKKKEIKANHLLFKKKGKLIAILPAGIANATSNRTLLSPYCASFGGFMHTKDLSLKDSLLVLDAFLEYCKEYEIGTVYITQPPQVYYEIPNEYIEFGLLKNGFAIHRYEVTIVMRLQDNLLYRFDHEARKGVRRAEKSGVIVSEAEVFEPFYDILVDNRRKLGAIPAHSLEDLYALKERLPDKIKLFMAYLNDEPIAGTLIFVCTKKTILDYYWAHRDEYQKVRPINKLIYDVGEWGRRNGFQFFDFGTTTLNMVPNWGGAKFKERHNARGVLRTTFMKTT